MFGFIALTYGVLASFIMSSVSRNRRAERANPAIVTLFGWGLMAFSMAAAFLILSYVVFAGFAGQPVHAPIIA